MKLRDYQVTILKSLSAELRAGARRIIVTAPTGSGKTLIMSYLTRILVGKNLKGLIITDRKELVKQTTKTLAKVGERVSFIMPARRENLTYKLNVAMAQTLKRRVKTDSFKDFPENLGFVLIDECHGRVSDFIHPLLLQNCVVVGFTATPTRLGKKDLLKDFYQKLVQKVTVRELIDKGYLAPARHYSVKGTDLSDLRVSNGEYTTKSLEKTFKKPKLYKGVLSNYKRLCNNSKFICYCASITIAQDLHKEFIKEGYKVGVIDSKNTNSSERDKILKSLETGELTGVINVGILTTGFDMPSLETIILYRATMSLSLYLQMIGRGSRLSPNKKFFNILDLGGNIKRFYLFQTERNWTLNEADPKKGKKGVAPIKECPGCGYIMAPVLKVCPSCGHEFPLISGVAEEVYLEEVKFEEAVQLAVNTKPEINIANKVSQYKGYKNGFILRRFTTRSQFEDYASIRGYKKGWVDQMIKFYEV